MANKNFIVKNGLLASGNVTTNASIVGSALVGNTLSVGGITVSTANASVNNVLLFNGTSFVPDDLAIASAINDLTDVVISSSQAGQVLKYNGTNWVNDTDNDSSVNLDGGIASSTYGGILSINGGSA
jgi:hypothetical protein